MVRCQATTKKGRQCKKKAGPDSKYCRRHQQTTSAALAATAPTTLLGSLRVLPGIVVGNLVPAVGVVWFDWKVAVILSLYWLENLIVGFFTFWKMRMAPDVRTPNRPGIWFFLFHYCLFTAVHGLFVIMLTSESNPKELFNVMSHFWDGLLICSLALFGQHALWFYFGYFQNESFKRTTANKEMYKPYPRLIAMHCSLLIGAVLIGNRHGIILLLVVLHLFIDIVTWAIKLPKESSLRRILNAALAGVIVGGLAAFFIFIIGVFLTVVGRFVLFGINAVTGESVFAETGRWGDFLGRISGYALAGLICFTTSAFALLELLDCEPKKGFGSAQKKRLVCAIVGAMVTTAFFVWGVTKVLARLERLQNPPARQKTASGLSVPPGARSTAGSVNLMAQTRFSSSSHWLGEGSNAAFVAAKACDTADRQRDTAHFSMS